MNLIVKAVFKALIWGIAVGGLIVHFHGWTLGLVVGTIVLIFFLALNIIGINLSKRAVSGSARDVSTTYMSEKERNKIMSSLVLIGHSCEDCNNPECPFEGKPKPTSKKGVRICYKWKGDNA
jgi:hypothetical protein